MDSSQDLACIEKILNGDSRSYEFLVEKYKRMVYTIAIRLLRNPEDARDAAQESFVKAYQQLAAFRGNSKFSTWLHTITYRICIARLRQPGLDTSPIDEITPEAEARASCRSQTGFMDAKDQQKYVRRAIDGLPPVEGVLVTLYYLNENSIREIEEITGMSNANIKIRLYRARKKLETQLRFLIDHELAIIPGDGR